MNNNDIPYSLLMDKINGEPLATIYTVSNGITSKCFDTLEAREEYIKNNKIPICIRYTVNYYGNIGDRKNIIRELNPKLGNGFDQVISVGDRQSYEILDWNLSKSKDTLVWRSSNQDINDKLILLQALISKFKKMQNIQGKAK